MATSINRHRNRSDHMALELKTKLEAELIGETLLEIIQVTEETGHLTARSEDTLRKLLDNSRLAMVFDADVLVGWALREPLTKKLSEVGMAYVKPEYRGTPAFKMMTEEFAKNPESFVFATYNRFLIDYTVREFGFVEVDLKEVLRISHWRFLLKRIKPKTMFHIRKKLQEQTPIYAIWYR